MFKLIQYLPEEAKRLLHRLGLLHVHARQLQKLDGRPGTAALQKFKIAVQRRFPFLQNPARNGDGRRKSRRVLIDVKRRLRSKSELHNEMQQKSKRESEESQLPSKSRGCNENARFQGQLRFQRQAGDVPQPCRTVRRWFS